MVEPLLGLRAEKLYEMSREKWQWNSRYWEQVALMNLALYRKGSNDPERLRNAIQHARHAVALETHPLSLTTLGKVLFASLFANDFGDIELLDEAIRRLDLAISMERKWLRPFGHSYVTLFSGVRQYLQKDRMLTDIQRGIVFARIEEARKLFKGDPEVVPEIEKIEKYFRV